LIKAKNEESNLRLAEIKNEYEYEFERDIVTYHTCRDTIIASAVYLTMLQNIVISDL